MPPSTIEEAFYVVAREPGHETRALPTWTDRGPGSVTFEAAPSGSVIRREISEVPGVFQLLNVLTENECEQFIDITNRLGYHTDAPVSLPYSVRHNTNLNWIVHQSIDGPIWERCAHLITERVGGQAALGLNARFRFYRYASGDFFKPHTDGAWTESRVIDGQLIHDGLRRSHQPDVLSCVPQRRVHGRAHLVLYG